MTVLLDTNVIMDALQERLPFDAQAKKILLLGQSGEIKCCFTANAATDIFYLYGKTHGKKAANGALTLLLNTYGVVPIAHNDCLKALALPNDDFEDALAEVCAKKIGADFIISRDERFITAATEVKVITPADLLAKINDD